MNPEKEKALKEHIQPNHLYRRWTQWDLEYYQSNWGANNEKRNSRLVPFKRKPV